MKKSATVTIFIFLAAFAALFFAPLNRSHANQLGKFLPPAKDKPFFHKTTNQNKPVDNKTVGKEKPADNKTASSKKIAEKNKSDNKKVSVPVLKIGIPNGKRTVIIEVDLENYLNGVVGGEMSADWPLEALKAQAVAARTFSLYSKGRHQSEGYDLCATTHCQIYDGIANAGASVKKAVAATQGEIITYDSKPIYAAFHADSGGCTADSAEVWGNELPYLKAVKDGEGSPQRHWQANFTAKDIEAKLRAASKDIGYLKKITINSRTRSGRVKDISFHGTRHNVTLNGTQARQVLGLKSALFNISADRKFTKICIDGDGSGHGLGLSQWGAYRLAAKKSYRDILNLYYTNVKITKLY